MTPHQVSYRIVAMNIGLMSFGASRSGSADAGRKEIEGVGGENATAQEASTK